MTRRALGILAGCFGLVAFAFSAHAIGSRATPTEVIAHARALRSKGQLDEAQRLLEPLRLGSEAGTRAEALSLLARIAWSRGDAEEALHTFVEAEQLARASSLHALAAGNATARADTLRRHLGDLRGARAALRQAEADLAHAPEIAPHHAYQRALVERDAGQLREAARFFDQAAERAQAQKLPSLLIDIEQVRAPIAFALGQEQQAFARLRGLAATEVADPCRRAHLLTNLGWLSLIAAERTAQAPDYPALEEAQRLYRSTCPNAHDAANATLNLALADLASHKLESARLRLRSVMASGSDAPALTAAYTALVDAALEAEAGHAEQALALYADLARRMELSAGADSLRNRVALARGRLLTQLGRTVEARSVYARAETQLEQTIGALPFVRGLDAYVGAQETGAYALMELLVASAGNGGQAAAEAFDVARLARTRVLRSLARSLDLGRLELAASAEVKRLERAYEAARAALKAAEIDTWQIPLDELAERERELALLRRREEASLDALLAELPARALAQLRPDNDELVLGLFQAPTGIRVFTLQHGQVSTSLLSRPENETLEAWSDALLTPLSGQLTHASSLSIISDSSLQGVDVHALPFRGEPLIARMPVTYRVDVRPDAPRARPERTLIIADARSDLPLAALDGQAMQTLLGSSRSTHILARAAATHKDVVDALGKVSTFYFAGHSEQSGSHAFSAALLLADDARLEALEVLSLPQAPERVVLSSCESAQAKSRARAAGLGLAQAFVLRGSKVVLGTMRPVSDMLAAQLGQALRDDATPTFDIHHVRRALLSLRAKDKTNEWMSYRVLVP